MSEIRPVKISADSEYDGCTDEQVKRARERFIEEIDKDYERSRQSCYA